MELSRTHHRRRRVDVFQNCQVVFATDLNDQLISALVEKERVAHLHGDVVVDGNGNDLRGHVTDSEVGNELGVVHWQPLGDCWMSIKVQQYQNQR